MFEVMRTGVLLLAALAHAGGLLRADEGAREFTVEERQWWAIQELTEPDVPAAGKDWARNPLDRFVAARRKEAGLAPAPAAGRHELVRRAYFDLHGLPPSPEQVAAFINDERPDAWERLVDELLASPRYGERWGQHWLDVVRFAESDGYRQDAFRPDAYRYRDWVIRSLNSDKPYDRFVAEQLAGDEIDPDDPDSLIGTAFLRNGLYEYNQRDVRFHWELILNEVTNVTAEAFLGLGIGCAQCHDHKFDPLLQKDFYRLQAYLAPMRMRHDLVLASADEKKQYGRRLEEWRSATADLREEIDAIVEPKVQQKMKESLIKFPPDIQALFTKKEQERTPYEQQLVELARIQLDYERERFDENRIKGEDKERLRELRELLKAFEGLRPGPLPRAFVASDVGNRAPVVPLGGRPGVGIGDVQPGVPSIIDPATDRVEFSDRHTTGRRLALATWITNPGNPLTPRVLANRLWQHHFARGIVATPNDFGTLGESPSHPRLLDWLARRLLENGWQLKPLHRLIMSSATYCQTARAEPGEHVRAVDPDNRLLWRYPPRRLDAEQARDAILATSGELQLGLGGPSVEGTVPRRSIYVKKIRNSPDEMLKALDAPSGFESTGARSSTTTATQSLQLINGAWMTQRALAFARRLLGQRTSVSAAEISLAYRLAFSREAERPEVERALAFLEAQGSRLVQQAQSPPSNPKYPGLRPVTLQFGGVKGIGLGSQELQLQPGSPYERLHLAGVRMARDEFTLEAVTILDHLYPDADVRTLAARWNGSKSVGGWTFGVTSTKSKYAPRNLIMQLVGRDAAGEVVYEVVPSNLRVPLGKPVYLAASVSTAPAQERSRGGVVTFYLKDLSAPGGELQVASVPHGIVQGLQDPGVRVVIGGRDQPGRAMWDGELARLVIRDGVRSREKLLIAGGDASAAVADLLPGGQPIEEPFAGAKWLRPGLQGGNPALLALADFCHALLTSNEFLYLH